MTGLIRSHPLVSILIALVVGAAVVVAVWGVSSASGESRAAPAPTATRTTAAAPSASPTPTGSPTATPASCGSATTTVTTAVDLSSALQSAAAGDVIAVADGTYTGNFVASTSGTASQPITLCGGSGAILDGGDVSHGYVLHLDHVAHWTVSGLTLTNGQKGLVADGVTDSTIEGLTITTIGDEALHLRDNSSDNVVSGNTISDTGHRKPKFGEGIYIGSSKNNWCDVSNCQPDKSDRNVIEKNAISATTAESVDIKEGTTGGILRDNTFDGTGMDEGGADSWVDVKGNSWTIEGNHGTDSVNDGFQTHELLDGWGTDNVFRNNVADVNGPGYGYSLTPVLGNRVLCDNTASGAGEGLSNVTCSAS